MSRDVAIDPTVMTVPTILWRPDLRTGQVQCVHISEGRLHTWGLCSQPTEDDINCELRSGFRFGTAPTPNTQTVTSSGSW